MSESSLVSYTRITKNKTVMQNKKNLYIIPHVYVGQVTTKNGVNHFYNTSGASCNYVIGTDGTVGQCVSESDRSWCTGGTNVVTTQYGKFVGSSIANHPDATGMDYQAITIEMACDAKAPYAINDKVYTTLVKLMADIAKRNGMGKLKWKGDVGLVGNPKEQNVIVHRWFANKACPGDYIYNRLEDICARANAINGYGPTPSPEPTPEPTPSTDFKVKVTTSCLNIRSGPGIKYKIVGTITDKGIYTIVETSGTWGKLKSGRGWISLNYTRRV